MQIISLNEKVEGLVRDKTLLMDRCEAAIRASHAHAQGERDERLEGGVERGLGAWVQDVREVFEEDDLLPACRGRDG